VYWLISTCRHGTCKHVAYDTSDHSLEVEISKLIYDTSDESLEFPRRYPTNRILKLENIPYIRYIFRKRIYFFPVYHCKSRGISEGLQKHVD
jgi:hypothetical protein